MDAVLERDELSSSASVERKSPSLIVETAEGELRVTMGTTECGLQSAA